MQGWQLFVFLGLMACATVVADDAHGHLIVQKELITPFSGLFGSRKPINVTLTVFNVGTGSAFDVVVDDPWPAEHFDVTGESSGKWDEIPAGGKESFSFTVVPTVEHGQFQNIRAVVSYKPTADASTPQRGVSTGLQTMTVYPTESYEKATNQYTLEWTVFGVFAALTVLVPLLAYVSIQLNYENGIPKAALKSE